VCGRTPAGNPAPGRRGGGSASSGPGPLLLLNRNNTARSRRTLKVVSCSGLPLASSLSENSRPEVDEQRLNPGRFCQDLAPLTSSGEGSGSPPFLRSVTRPNIAHPSPVKLGAMLP